MKPLLIIFVALPFFSFADSPNKEGMRDVFRSHSSIIQNCYKKALAADPSIEGVVKLAFHISEGGKVEKARINESSTLKNKAVHDCLLSHLVSWIFPEPPEGRIISAEYPIFFEKNSN